MTRIFVFFLLGMLFFYVFEWILDLYLDATRKFVRCDAGRSG